MPGVVYDYYAYHHRGDRGCQRAFLFPLVVPMVFFCFLYVYFVNVSVRNRPISNGVFLHSHGGRVVGSRGCGHGRLEGRVFASVGFRGQRVWGRPTCRR